MSLGLTIPFGDEGLLAFWSMFLLCGKRRNKTIKEGADMNETEALSKDAKPFFFVRHLFRTPHTCVWESSRNRTDDAVRFRSAPVLAGMKDEMKFQTRVQL